LTARAIGRVRRARIDLNVFWRKRVRPRRFLYTDQFGVTLFVEPTQDLNQLFNDRRFFDDEGVLRLCRQRLRAGMTVVDVGANQGQFALFAASLVGPTGRIHSFEPSPGTYATLLENIRLNPHAAERIVANCKAVNDRPGTVTFHEYAPEYSVFNSMHAHKMQSPIINPDGSRDIVQPTASREVPAVTLDEYCDGQGLKQIDLLKIDVEGWEPNVIRGARKLVAEKRCGAVIFEISLDPLAGTPFTAPDVIRAFEELGLAVSRITAEGSLEPVKSTSFDAPFFANYLATLPA
jgi:FkbM family methyltransferase